MTTPIKWAPIPWSRAAAIERDTMARAQFTGLAWCTARAEEVARERWLHAGRKRPRYEVQRKDWHQARFEYSYQEETQESSQEPDK